MWIAESVASVSHIIKYFIFHQVWLLFSIRYWVLKTNKRNSRMKAMKRLMNVELKFKVHGFSDCHVILFLS